jgi:hypothetical protein
MKNNYFFHSCWNMNNFIVHVGIFKYLMCQHALLKINVFFDVEVSNSFGYYGNNL